MPRFAIVRPRAKKIDPLICTDYKSAVIVAGLEVGALDFGTVTRLHNGGSLSIIVYEYGLMRGDSGAYFSLCKNLYNGNAVLFQTDLEGETVDISQATIGHWNLGCPELNWLGTVPEVEKAIAAGLCFRPQNSINGQVIWSWNQSKES